MAQKSTGKGRKQGSTAKKSTSSAKTRVSRTSSPDTRKNSAETRKSSGSSASSYRSRNVKKKNSKGLNQDMIMIVLFAFMVFIFLANFKIMGPVGNAISGVFFGLFGFPQYILPIAIVALSGWYLMSEDREAVLPKIICCALLLLSFGILCEITANDLSSNPGYSISEIFVRSRDNRNGGGVFAGSIAFLLFHFLKQAGTILVLVMVLLVSVIVLSGKSFADFGDNSRQKEYEKDEPLEDEEEERYRRIRDEERLERQREDVEERELIQREREERIRNREMERKQALERQREMDLRSREMRENDRNRQESEEILRRADSYNLAAVSLGQDAMKAEAAEPASYSAGPVDNGIQTGEDSVYSVSRDLHEITVKDADYSPLSVKADVKENTLPRRSEYSGIAIPTPEETTPDYASDRFSDRVIRKGLEETFTYEAGAEALKVASNVASDAAAQTEADLPKPIKEPEAEPVKQSELKNALLEEETVTKENPSTQEVPEEEIKEIEVKREHPAARDNTSGVTFGGGIAAAEAKRNAEDERVSKHRAPYVYPTIDLLKEGKKANLVETDRELQETAFNLQTTLKTFGVEVTVPEVSQGPAVTRYELLPAEGVKVSKIVSLADDIKLNLAAADIRIEAPIPGKRAIGIEVPNKNPQAVPLRDLFESDVYKKSKSSIRFAVGKDIGGNVVVTDITKMPHMLIAGSTGSGKSVCINTLIMSILMTYRPDEVRMIMIDPKIVELSVYNGIPHLLLPVVTDPRKASDSLKWAVAEMTDRFRKFADNSVRDIKGYNEFVKASKDPDLELMPRIVIIVDELADLMMVSAKEVEESICRLAQLARAAGIHLIIATQRPSVDVITGLIKANMPSRIAFAVTSGVDSRTILDMNGAEKLLGKGDMLFYPQGYPKPSRIQGAFVSDEEVQDFANFIRYHNSSWCDLAGDVERKIESMSNGSSDVSETSIEGGTNDSDLDEHFVEAGYLIIEKQKASIGMLQRVYKIGFNRAARIMDQLCEAGVVSPDEGTKARKVLMTASDFESYIEENGI